MAASHPLWQNRRMALPDSGVRLRLWSGSDATAGMQQAILALTAAALLVAVVSLAVAAWQLYRVYRTEPLTIIVPALTR